MSPSFIALGITRTARIAAVLTVSLPGAFAPLFAHARPLLTHSTAERLPALDAGALSSNRTATLGRSLTLVPIVARIPGGRSYIRGKVLDGIRENSANTSWLDANSERSYSDPLVQNVDRSIAILQRLSQSNEPDSVVALVRRVRAPVTVVLGAKPHPSAPPEAQVTALSALQNCLRIVRLDNVGHFPHEEAPDRLVSVLDSSCHGHDAGVVR